VEVRINTSNVRLVVRAFLAWLVLIALPDIMLVGCGASSETPRLPPTKIVARLTNEKITRDEFLLDFARRNYKQAAHYLEEMALQRVMMIEAREAGISVESQELAKYVAELKEAYGQGEFDAFLSSSGLAYADWLAEAKADLIRGKLIEVNVASKASVTDEELSAYYEEHISEFRAEKSVRAFQILVDSNETAKQLLSLLNRGRRGFESLAREYSIAPEAAKGGELGWVKMGDLPAELQTPIFKLRKGKNSKVVETSHGFHIFRVEDLREAKVLPFEEALERVRREVLEQKANERYDEWIIELKAKWRLQVFPEELL